MKHSPGQRGALAAAVTHRPTEPTRRIKAVCFDLGDTLIDEATEEKDGELTTLRASLIPGAADLLYELKRRGYRLALVADTRPGTYRNVLRQHGLYELFDAFAISEELGLVKPDRRMFAAALEALGVEPPEAVMVGNFLERDVKGANEAGMVSVWIDWSPRRPKQPRDESERPHYTIRRPLELLAVLDGLEQEPQRSRSGSSARST